MCGCVRLAEGIEPPLFSSFAPTVAAGDAEVDLSSKLEVLRNCSGANRLNLVADGDGNVLGNSGNSSQEHYKNGGDGSADGANHQTNCNLEENCRKSYSNDVNLQISVANAFKAYEEFLSQLSRGNSPSDAGDLKLTANHQPVNSNFTPLEGHTSIPPEPNTATVDEEVQKLESNTPDALLIKDLETCFEWNLQSLSRILPSVFRHLPHLATGKDAMLSLLVSTIDPVGLSHYEYWLTVGELAVMGREVESLARLIRATLTWDSIEQQYFWRLMGAESLALSPAPVLQVSHFLFLLSLFSVGFVRLYRMKLMIWLILCPYCNHNIS